MRANVLKDGKGNAVATVLETGVANEVPLDAEADDGSALSMHSATLRAGELFDLDKLHKTLAKKAG